MKAAILASLIGAVAIYGAARHAPLEAALAGAGGAAISATICSWCQRRARAQIDAARAVLKAAGKLARTFCLSDAPCIKEVQGVAKAFYLWGGKC